MPRPVTLFTGQWADLPLTTMAQKAKAFGYDGIEIACWGDHMDVAAASSDKNYIQSRVDILNQNDLQCFAISNHLVGQAVCDHIDERHKAIVPERVWGDGKPEGVKQRAAEEMVLTGRAAAKLGVKVVNGFTGSSIWGALALFPPTSQEYVDAGFKDFARRWTPILDEYQKLGVRFALEVHPGEIAYDYHTARRALDAVKGHPAFGFNFDPSHLIWQGVDPARFVEDFGDRIFHVHMKDTSVYYNPAGTGKGGDGTRSCLGSHLAFGDPRRGWDFRSVGRGHVNFDEIIRALNRVDYNGPLSVEWEDAGMDREQGARESCAFVRKVDIVSAGRAFDAAFERK